MYQLVRLCKHPPRGPSPRGERGTVPVKCTVSVLRRVRRSDPGRWLAGWVSGRQGQSDGAVCTEPAERLGLPS